MTNSIKRKLAAFAAACMAFMQTALLPASAETTEVPDFSVLGAVGCFTAEETQKIAEQIYLGFASHSSVIVLAGEDMPLIPKNENGSIAKIAYAVADMEACMLVNDSKFGYASSGDYITKMGNIKYFADDASYEQEYSETIAMIDEITAGVQDSWSDMEKALYLHEYVADHFSYDNNVYEDGTEEEKLARTAYGMLQRKMGVCEGYAELYHILMQRVGINSVIVSSLQLNHAWNMIEIDGSWYHVDLTFDDVFGAMPGRVKHDSFLKGDQAIRASGHDAADWNLISSGMSAYDLPVSDKYDNGFWNGSTTTIEALPDGRWLGIYSAENDASTGMFAKCTVDPADGSAEKEIFLSLSDRWYVPNDPNGAWYDGTYIVTDLYEGDVYYTTPQNLMGIRNGQVVWLFGLTEEQKAQGMSIYGMCVKDGMLYYYIAEGANAITYTAEYSVNIADLQAQLTAAAGEQQDVPATEETTEPVETTTEPTETTTVPTETTTQASDEETDDTVSVIDVVALQRFLVGEGEASAEYDMTGDGVIDAFDLAILKRYLLEQHAE